MRYAIELETGTTFEIEFDNVEEFAKDLSDAKLKNEVIVRKHYYIKPECVIAVFPADTLVRMEE